LLLGVGQALAVLIVAGSGRYLKHVLRDGVADWQSQRQLTGGRPRRALIVGSLVAGGAIALATWSVQSSWLGHHHHRHGAGADATAYSTEVGR
jgi:hypothetical protein